MFHKIIHNSIIENMYLDSTKDGENNQVAKRENKNKQGRCGFHEY